MKTLLDILLAALLAIFATACSSDSSAPSPDEPQPEPARTEALLSLRVAIADAASRAPQNSSIEDMRELRIVITRPDGKVEVNYLTNFGGVPAIDYFGVFRLTPGEDKTIYAIANPSSTGFPFESYPVGSKGIIEALEEYSYDFDGSLPIAMTDSRDVAAASLLPGERIDVALNVVRVAAKFTVTIDNRRDEDVTIRSFSVSSLADREYLMPHFSGDTGLHIISNEGLKGFDFGSATGLHWSDWLRLAVDESQAAPEDELLADERGWIMKYAVPEAATHTVRNFDFNGFPLIRQGESTTLPGQYFAESRSGLKEVSEFGLGAAAGLEQSYTYSVAFASPNGTVKEFRDMPFPNLRALFRNTHVAITLEISQMAVIPVQVDVMPYFAKELKPSFGLAP